MQPTDSPPSDPLLGNSLSGIIGCALDASTIPVSVADFPENWEPPTPGHIAVLLPQYQIESLIGRGGMGAVYKGRQITLQRPVAIKVLPAELARNTEFVARFHREAQLLASLSHQGIVTIFDFGQTTEGHLYFVMEYVDGTDLYRLIHKSGTQLDAKQALSLTVQICEAMQYAHDNGVVHRDIKPANVLVTRDGRAKLADFGLAMKPTDPDAMHVPPKPGAYFDPSHSPNVAEMRFTQPGAAMGTPDYAAPEVYDGKADERSDIYALGIMLYEMLTGAPPKGYFQLPSALAPVDHRVDQVVVKALEIDPAARYQKASDMQLAVEAATRPLPKRSQIKLPPTVPSRQAVTSAARVPPPAQVPQRSRQSGWFGKLVVAALMIIGVAVAYDAGQKWAMSKRLLALLSSRLGTQGSGKVSNERRTVSHAASTNPSAFAAVAVPSYASDPVLGRWWWPGEYIVTFTADGKFNRSDGSHGVWSCEPGKPLPLEYMLRWEGVNVDRLTLNKDASVLDGFIVNYRNARITAYRVPENPEPPPGGSSVMHDEGFTPLLNRDHTDGWQHSGKGSMRHNDGVFITSTPAGVREPWGIYWYSARKFSDFVLRLEFAVDTFGSNSGVFFGLSPLIGEAIPLYPSGSMEVEIKGLDTGGIGEPAKVYKLPFTARKWHTLEIAVIGNTVTTQIDDNTVGSRILDRKLDGYIGLQNFGCCGSAYFRNVRIKEVKATSLPVISPPTTSPPKPSSNLVTRNNVAVWLRQARDAAAAVTEEKSQAALLKELARVQTRFGDVSNAVMIARSITDDAQRDAALAAVASELAKQKDIPAALAAARLVSDEGRFDGAIVGIITVLLEQNAMVEANALAARLRTPAGKARHLAELGVDDLRRRDKAQFLRHINEAKEIMLKSATDSQPSFRAIAIALVKGGDVAAAKNLVPHYKGHRFGTPLVSICEAQAKLGDFAGAHETFRTAGFSMYPHGVALARIADAEAAAGKFDEARRTAARISYADHRLIAQCIVEAKAGNVSFAKQAAEKLFVTDQMTMDALQAGIHANAIAEATRSIVRIEGAIAAHGWASTLSRLTARVAALTSLADTQIENS